jgi:hypothetical protein
MCLELAGVGELRRRQLPGLLIPFKKDDVWENHFKSESQLDPKPIRKGCVY